jgi:hypothetical protein
MTLSYARLIIGIYLIRNIQISYAFPQQRKHNQVCKKIRIQCKLFVKRNFQDIKSDKSVLVENIKSVIKDDITNDVLYYFRFYHLTSDADSSYFYIIFYELVNIAFFKSEDRIKSLPISLTNVVIYIILKNIILQHIMHHK